MRTLKPRSFRVAEEKKKNYKISCGESFKKKKKCKQTNEMVQTNGYILAVTFYFFCVSKSLGVDMKANINITMTNCLPESSCKVSL